MLKAENIKLSFGENEVLKGISLEIEKGQVISIIGPSGSGKSTFLRSLNFLEIPKKGKISFDGKTYDVERISKKEVNELRKYTTMVFQNYNLFKNKTALENVIEGPVIVKKMDKKEAKKQGILDGYDWFLQEGYINVGGRFYIGQTEANIIKDGDVEIGLDLRHDWSNTDMYEDWEMDRDWWKFTADQLGIEYPATLSTKLIAKRCQEFCLKIVEEYLS